MEELVSSNPSIAFARGLWSTLPPEVRALATTEGIAARMETAWREVSAVRMAGQLVEVARAHGDGAGGDEAVARVPGASVNIEQQYARRWSKEAFEEAFAVALGELTDREKALLRLHHIDGVSLEQL